MSDKMKKIEVQGGKEYVMVHERVMEFHRRYPDGMIETDVIEMTDRFITKTKVTPNVTTPERFFTGWAYEKEDGNFINKASALENCETSSVGRALGWLNIGIDTSIATADEVANAINQKRSPKTPKVNLKDVEVKIPKQKDNDSFKKLIDDTLDGMPMDDENWDGTEVIKFGKYKNNTGDSSNDITWADIEGESYLEWLLENSKADWIKEKATLELERRGVKVGGSGI